ncbi:MAG: 3-phosphoshikimate 1-carboxyvinyltransferase [Candidatus Omnitrophica bacterium]|nr:3-phosphoshikimate 1-carboxyvinyltransferase [Candidatus Omnitrophota bacterium]
MEALTVRPGSHLAGILTVPGDKSISHRALMFGALAQGATRITHCLDAEDCRATQTVFSALGIRSEWNAKEVIVEGKGLHGLKAAAGPLDCGNSGTSMRLLMGILAGQSFSTTLTGDASLSRRPMGRVAKPLRAMGAVITGKEDGNFAPLTIQGGALRGMVHTLEVPSAQVKSAILLAGLYASGQTVVKESILTRDHTERMMVRFGAAVSVIGDISNGRTVAVQSGRELHAQSLDVPGDISSAAFWMVAAAITPGSRLTVKRVGLNPTRTGILDVLKSMGASLGVLVEDPDAPEPMGDVTVGYSPLHGTTISETMLPRLIDELPILMVAAAAAEGRTIIENAKELRVKETDRIQSMAQNLTAVGAKMMVEGDTIVLDGPTRFRPAKVSSFGDHRTAMAMAIAALSADGPIQIEDVACIRTSYPSFFSTLKTLVEKR